MSRIFITGDTHGDIDYAKLNTRQFKEQKNLTKDDYVIVLGDFGVLWNSYTKYCPDRLSKRDLNFINWYENKNFTTLWIDGNHDNHIALLSRRCPKFLSLTLAPHFCISRLTHS